jgi:hypothetical protein
MIMSLAVRTCTDLTIKDGSASVILPFWVEVDQGCGAPRHASGDRHHVFAGSRHRWQRSWLGDAFAASSRALAIVRTLLLEQQLLRHRPLSFITVPLPRIARQALLIWLSEILIKLVVCSHGSLMQVR